MKFRHVAVVAMLAFLAGAAVSAALLLAVMWSRLTGASVAVLQARQNLAQWTTLGNPDELFTVTYVPRDSLPPNVIAGDAVHEVKGRRLRQNLRAGELLTEDHLLAREVSRLGQALDPRKWVSITVSGDKQLGFSLEPGCRVDVVQTKDGKPTVVLEDVLLLALDSHEYVFMATVEMPDPEDAAKLAKANESGSLSVVASSGRRTKKTIKSEVPVPEGSP